MCQSTKPFDCVSTLTDVVAPTSPSFTVQYDTEYVAFEYVVQATFVGEVISGV